MNMFYRYIAVKNADFDKKFTFFIWWCQFCIMKFHNSDIYPIFRVFLLFFPRYAALIFLPPTEKLHNSLRIASNLYRWSIPSTNYCTDFENTALSRGAHRKSIGRNIQCDRLSTVWCCIETVKAACPDFNSRTAWKRQWNFHFHRNSNHKRSCNEPI